MIIGGGKTAMDTAVWLLEQGVDPDVITWIRPREAWVLNRSQYQTNVEAFERTIGGFAMELERASQATSIESLFAQLEAHDLPDADRAIVAAFVFDPSLIPLRFLPDPVQIRVRSPLRSASRSDR